MTSEPPGTIRALEGRPILWTDEAGVTHRCEGVQFFPDCPMLLWTVCGRHLSEENVAFLPADEDKVSGAPR
jgi:hypothetical protein